MIFATDSFIQYLKNELGATPAVYWVRTSPDPATSELQMNALNVSVLTFTEDGSLERPLVSLDIIGTDERQAYVWAKRVRDVLIQQQYTPEIDYATNPSTPAPVGGAVFWDGRTISFDKVRQSPHMIHLNATFRLAHAR